MNEKKIRKGAIQVFFSWLLLAVNGMASFIVSNLV